MLKVTEEEKKKCESTKKSEIQKWCDYIKNMPISCTYCGKEHSKDEIQYIQVRDNRNEAVCNIECAIKLGEHWISIYKENIKDIEEKIKMLRSIKK